MPQFLHARNDTELFESMPPSSSYVVRLASLGGMTGLCVPEGDAFLGPNRKCSPSDPLLPSVGRLGLPK
jgi:hypothetical protein